MTVVPDSITVLLRRQPAARIMHQVQYRTVPPFFGVSIRIYVSSSPSSGVVDVADAATCPRIFAHIDRYLECCPRVKGPVSSSC